VWLSTGIHYQAASCTVRGRVSCSVNDVIAFHILAMSLRNTICVVLVFFLSNANTHRQVEREIFHHHHHQPWTGIVRFIDSVSMHLSNQERRFSSPSSLMPNS
jgi:hypothetical protein